jgi:2-amino-4-hydroxy-6-hydroxymethyldihydropteridine diphosphokinase
MRLTIAYLLLGSNADPEINLARAVRRLRDFCDVLSVSSLYRTKAAGETTGGADYLNAAVKVSTTLSPADFKVTVLRKIEDELGRQRETQRSIVPIDLDIALWGDTALEYGDKPWRVPSPDIVRHAYAAVPLADIAPDAVHPQTGQTLWEIAATLDASGVENVGHLPGFER